MNDTPDEDPVVLVLRDYLSDIDDHLVAIANHLRILHLVGFLIFGVLVGFLLRGFFG